MKYCDDAGQEPCPHPDDCTIPCRFNFEAVRKVKPYPEVPPDMYSVQREFDVISKRLLWAAAAFLVVFVANLLLAGYHLLVML